MRAAFCPGPGRVAVRDAPEPRPRDDEVVLQVRACGLCGSDLHWFTGAVAPPRVCPGHEMAGEIAALGAGVTGLRLGDRVTVEPLAVCGGCPECRGGRPQLCARRRILGLQRDGGLAERVAVPARAVFPVPAQMDWATAALAEPLAVGVHAVRLAAVAPGQRVLILGAGAVGLLAVLAARAAGAEVWVSARHPHQAALAARLGAARVLAATPAAEAERAALAAAEPVDVVLETVGGTATTLAEAVASVRPGGTVVVLGVFTAAPSLPALAVLTKEVRLLGSMMYDRRGTPVDFAAAIALLAADAQAAGALVTHRLPLDAVQRAFDVAADRRAGAVKVAVTP